MKYVHSLMGWVLAVSLLSGIVDDWEDVGGDGLQPEPPRDAVHGNFQLDFQGTDTPWSPIKDQLTGPWQDLIESHDWEEGMPEGPVGVFWEEFGFVPGSAEDNWDGISAQWKIGARGMVFEDGTHLVVYGNGNRWTPGPFQGVGGVLRSTDYGLSWENVEQWPEYNFNHSGMNYLGKVGDRWLLMVTNVPDTPLPGEGANGTRTTTRILYSDDDGITWTDAAHPEQETNLGNGAESFTHFSLVELPDGELRLYGPYEVGVDLAFLSSRDRGETWKAVVFHEDGSGWFTPLPDGPVYYSETHDRFVWLSGAEPPPEMAAEEDVPPVLNWWSKDGIDWQPLEGMPTTRGARGGNRAFYTDNYFEYTTPAGETVVVAVTRKSLLISRDDGLTWEQTFSFDRFYENEHMMRNRALINHGNITDGEYPDFDAYLEQAERSFEISLAYVYQGKLWIDLVATLYDGELGFDEWENSNEDMVKYYFPLDAARYIRSVTSQDAVNWTPRYNRSFTEFRYRPLNRLHRRDGIPPHPAPGILYDEQNPFASADFNYGHKGHEQNTLGHWVHLSTDADSANDAHYLTVARLDYFPLASADIVPDGNGWRESDWFGFLYSESDSLVLYHADLGYFGFVYEQLRDESALLYHDASDRWIWTSESAWPFAYDFSVPAGHGLTAEQAQDDEPGEWIWFDLPQVSGSDSEVWYVYLDRATWKRW